MRANVCGGGGGPAMQMPTACENPRRLKGADGRPGAAGEADTGAG